MHVLVSIWANKRWTESYSFIVERRAVVDVIGTMQQTEPSPPAHRQTAETGHQCVRDIFVADDRAGIMTLRPQYAHPSDGNNAATTNARSSCGFAHRV